MAKLFEEIFNIRPWEAVHSFEAQCCILRNTGASYLKYRDIPLEGESLRRQSSTHQFRRSSAFLSCYVLSATLNLGY